jgi:hypothetical protein
VYKRGSYRGLQKFRQASGTKPLKERCLVSSGRGTMTLSEKKVVSAVFKCILGVSLSNVKACFFFQLVSVLIHSVILSIVR